MCQREVAVGSVIPCTQPKYSRDELRTEIDMRVGAKLVESEIRRYQYWRGASDAIWFVVAILATIWLFWPNLQKLVREK